jgi:ABC-type multidrug transport system fused ATPase/permease subunit
MAMLHQIKNILKTLRFFNKSNLFVVFALSILANIFQTLLLYTIPLLAFLYMGKSFSINSNQIIEAISIYLHVNIDFLNLSYFTLALAIASVISNLLYLSFSTQSSFLAAQRIQVSTYSFFLNKPYSFFLKKNKNDLLNKSVVDSIRIPNGIFIPFFNIFNSLILAIMIFLFLTIINPLVIGGVSLVLILCYFLLFKKIKPVLQNFSIARSQYSKNFIEIGNFILGTNKDIKHYNKENYFLQKIEETAKKEKQLRIYLNLLASAPKIVLEGIIIFITIFFMIYSIQNSLFSERIILEFLTIIVMFLRILPIVQLIFSQFSIIESNISVLNKVNLLTKKIDLNNLNISNDNFERRIELKNIVFNYTNKKIFKKLNLTISKGEKIAIVGANGSGKTTLINILSGFLKPQRGIIKIDNKLNPNKLYNYFGTVSANPLMLEGSLYENISMSGEVRATEKNNIKKILYEIGMGHLYQNFSNRNKNAQAELSQGEKQAVTLARFLYFKKPILIIDEGTANLRNELEKSLLKNIIKIRKDITIIFITHRFTNLNLFEKIYEIKNKRLKVLNKQSIE